MKIAENSFKAFDNYDIRDLSVGAYTRSGTFSEIESNDSKYAVKKSARSHHGLVGLSDGKFFDDLIYLSELFLKYCLTRIILSYVSRISMSLLSVFDQAFDITV